MLEQATRDTGTGVRAPALLGVSSIRFSYGAITVLFDVSLEIRPGELLAVVGPNGAGKSTLLRVLSGMARIEKGAITFNGKDLSQAPLPDYLAEGIVLIPENKAIFADMTVLENLQMGAYTVPRRERDARLDEVITIFPRLGERYRQHAGTMSGGERQMLSIGKALLLRPKLLLVDELTLGLAPIVVESLLEAVRTRNEAGTTVVIVEQSLNVAASISDRAIFLEKGRIAFEGPTRALLERRDLTKAVLFGQHAETEA